MTAIQSLDHATDAPQVLQVPPAAQANSAKGPRRRVGTVNALYAHAMGIENEAIERYREFSAWMTDCGNDTVAELFDKLADFEAQHAVRLAKKCAGMSLPKLDCGEYAWVDRDVPVPEAHAFVLRMLTPRLALEIALRAELRAKDFFEKVLEESSDTGICDVARDMAREEHSHIGWVHEALARLPMRYRPSEELPGDPTIPQQL